MDDNIEYMKRVLSIPNPSFKTVAYVQYLYGVNTNNRKNKSSMLLYFGSFFPWRFIVSKYRKLLSRFDYIIANSQTCGFIVRQFYDLKVSGIVYPPVGVDIREIICDSEIPKKSGIFVYVGHFPEEYFIRNLEIELTDIRDNFEGRLILLAGNKETSQYFSRRGFESYSKISVDQLVKFFRQSIVTYVPTAYELFGYVGAESILCGTPVILDTYHPFLERFPMDTMAVRIAKPQEKISEALKIMLGNEIDILCAQNSIEKNYSVEKSAQQMLNALDLS